MKETIKRAVEGKTVHIITHEDGDGVVSGLALILGLEVTTDEFDHGAVYSYNHGGTAPNLSGLTSNDVVFILDLPYDVKYRANIKDEVKVINIDHHKSNTSPILPTDERIVNPFPEEAACLTVMNIFGAENYVPLAKSIIRAASDYDTFVWDKPGSFGLHFHIWFTESDVIKNKDYVTAIFNLKSLINQMCEPMMNILHASSIADILPTHHVTISEDLLNTSKCFYAINSNIESFNLVGTDSIAYIGVVDDPYISLKLYQYFKVGRSVDLIFYDIIKDGVETCSIRRNVNATGHTARHYAVEMRGGGHDNAGGFQGNYNNFKEHYGITEQSIM